MKHNHNILNIEPIFTLSPNPHLDNVLNPKTPTKLISTPYNLNISSGKNTYIYDAHTYHTKVPPEGIEKLIEYFTEEGQTILDSFCGSGMTGIAATQKGRKAILGDLSPAATFIAYNMNTPIDSNVYLHAINSIVIQAKQLEEDLYGTNCRFCGKKVPVIYTVWSYGALCNHCNKEFILWDVTRDEKPNVKESKIRSEFNCPHCKKHLHRRELKRTKRYPVQIGYKCCQGGLRELTAELNQDDIDNLKRIEKIGVPSNLWYPTNPLPEGINTKQPIAAGITTVDKMYTTRALWAMAYLWDIAMKWEDPEVRMKLLFTLTSLYKRVTVFSEFRFWGGSGNTANLSVPSIMNEQNVFKTFLRKANTISWYFKSVANNKRDIRVTTQSATKLPQLPDKSVDYVFVDPPFGGNINYSEVNFLWESWLKVFTQTEEEAIINNVQGKGTNEYRDLLSHAFKEINRVLKKKGWLTIVFHNSSADVWRALQEAIENAGFSIRGTQTFDKKHGTFKQFVSKNAVGYDLVLHCQSSDDKQLHLVKNAVTEDQVRYFINHALSALNSSYKVKYLHVARNEEFDYRKLYAEWLAYVLPNSSVGLSFDKFRGYVDNVIKK